VILSLVAGLIVKAEKKPITGGPLVGLGASLWMLRGSERAAAGENAKSHLWSAFIAGMRALHV
jgi:hypothetical protein